MAWIKKFGRLALILAGIGFLAWWYGSDQRFNLRPIRPKSIEFQAGPNRSVYKLESTSKQFPRFKLAVIEPKDVKPGDIQQLTVEVDDPSEVTRVYAETDLDHGLKRLPLELRLGDKKSGFWTNAWRVSDTTTKTYRTKFFAVNEKGQTASVVLAWSDTCTPPLSGDWIVAAACTITSVTGADAGNIIMGTSTITISTGGVLVYNSGKSITLSPGGYIALNTTGTQIAKANLFITDADGDGYQSSTYTTTYSTAASLAGYVRRSSALGSDCNDANSIVQTNRTQYTDTDGDLYTVGGTSICASAASWGDAACTTAGSSYMKNSAGSCVIAAPLSGTDCYDNNNCAKPGQTSWFTVQRNTVSTGCTVFNGGATDSAGNLGTSFDYDCNSTEEQEWTAITTTDCICPTHPSGWSVSVPACGVSGTWLDPSGTCVCSSKNSVGGQLTASSARTQACH